MRLLLFCAVTLLLALLHGDSLANVGSILMILANEMIRNWVDSLDPECRRPPSLMSLHLAVKKYSGAINYRERIYSTFTPCGNFLFSGSEDGMAYVWNTYTGDQVAVYSELCYRTALHSVAFHPHENMVAFCAYGQSQPIHVYLYDRKVSQLEMHNVKAASTVSRAASVDARTIRHTPDPPALQDTALAMDQFAQATRLSLKMQYVKEQLDSALEPHPRFSTSGYMNEQDKMGIAHTGRSLTSDSGPTGLNSSLPPPSFLSPHSKLQLSGALAEQLIPQAALSTQNRGFSPIGQRPRGASPYKQSTLPDSLPSGLRVETDSPPVQQVVVSRGNYKANRADELTVRRGDVIQVLYKDNEWWWFGRLANGQQGYFLASHVADQIDFNDEATQSNAALSEGTVGRSTPTRVSAAVSSSGELMFLSEPTLSDTEPELADARARRKKKVKKSGGASFSDASESSRRRGGSTERPLPKRPTGRTNGAFEPET